MLVAFGSFSLFIWWLYLVLKDRQHFRCLLPLWFTKYIIIFMYCLLILPLICSYMWDLAFKTHIWCISGCILKIGYYNIYIYIIIIIIVIVVVVVHTSLCISDGLLSSENKKMYPKVSHMSITHNTRTYNVCQTRIAWNL